MSKYALMLVCILTAICIGCNRHVPSPAVNEDAEELLVKGQELTESGELDSALTYYNKALETAPELPDSTLGYLYAQISATWQMKGDMPRSLHFGKRALEYGERAFAHEDYAILAGNLGISYRRSGMNDSALYFYEKGLEHMEKAVGNEDVSAFLCNNMSVLYCEMERYDESIGFARRAADFARQGNDDTEYYSALANQGIALAKQGKNEEAKKILVDVYARSADMSHRVLGLKTLSYLISIARAEGDDAAVENWFDEAEPLLEGMPPESIQAQGIADARMNYAFEHGRYAEALNQAAVLDSLKDRMLVIPLYKLRRIQSRCLSSMGRWEEALRYERMATAEQDSVASADITHQLSEYSVKFKTQQAEIALLKAENEARRKTMTIWILAGAFLLLAAVMAFLIYFYRTRRKREEEKHRMERTQRYLEGLEEERARVAAEIHDGACNDLLGISMMLRNDTADRAELGKRIDTLRDGLRRMSHEQMPPEFLYADLNEILEDYLEHLPHTENVSLRFISTGSGWNEMPHAVSYQFYRIAQESLSNSLRHSGASDILLEIECDGRHLRMTVSDNGLRASRGEATKGLRSIKERAAGIGAELAIEETETGFFVSVCYGKP